MLNRFTFLFALSFAMALSSCSHCNYSSDHKGSSDEALFDVQVGGKSGYIDKSGRLVVQPQFDVARPFSEGLAAVRVGDLQTGKWGYIDQTGRLVISPRFREADDFSNGLALANMNLAQTEEVYIDKNGNSAIKTDQFKTDGITEVQFASKFSDGLAVINARVGEHHKYGYINTEGKIAIAPQFEEPSSEAGVTAPGL